MFSQTSLRKLGPAGIVALFYAIYLPSGYAVIQLLCPEIDTPGEITFSLLMPSPAFLLMLFWFWIEARMGRPLIARPGVDHRPRSHAQRRTERLSLIVLCLLIPFLSSSPLIAALASGEFPTLMGWAPVLVWAFIIRAFGFERMRFAMSHLLPSTHSGVTQAETEKAFLNISVCAIARMAYRLSGNWELVIEIHRPSLLPALRGHVRSMPDNQQFPQPVRIDLTDQECLVLQVMLTGNGDPHRLLQFHPPKYPISFDDLSSHARLACLSEASEARASLSRLFP